MSKETDLHEVLTRVAIKESVDYLAKILVLDLVLLAAAVDEEDRVTGANGDGTVTRCFTVTSLRYNLNLCNAQYGSYSYTAAARSRQV